MCNVLTKSGHIELNNICQKYGCAKFFISETVRYGTELRRASVATLFICFHLNYLVFSLRVLLYTIFVYLITNGEKLSL